MNASMPPLRNSDVFWMCAFYKDDAPERSLAYASAHSETFGHDGGIDDAAPAPFGAKYL
jgi:hypothetical protein